MTVSASIYAGARVRHTGALDLGTPAVEIDTGRKNFDFVDGVTAGKADRNDSADHRNDPLTHGSTPG